MCGSTTGVVLAAGRGSRMGELTSTRPKCLLEIGGRAILHRTLDAFDRAGAARVVIVAGYRAEAIREALREREAPSALVVCNEDWGTTGTAASLALGLEAIGEAERVVIVEGDVVFEPELLKLLFATDADATLGTRRSPSLTGSMLVVDADQRVGEWIHADDGKRLPDVADPCFKSVNMTALRVQFARNQLLPVLRSCVAQRPDASLEWSLSQALHASGRGLSW